MTNSYDRFEISENASMTVLRNKVKFRDLQAHYEMDVFKLRDIEITSHDYNKLYFKGQKIKLSNMLNKYTNYQITKITSDSSEQFIEVTDDHGELVVDTSQLGVGVYRIQTNNESITFTVVDMFEYSAETTTDKITTKMGEYMSDEINQFNYSSSKALELFYNKDAPKTTLRTIETHNGLDQNFITTN